MTMKTLKQRIETLFLKEDFCHKITTNDILKETKEWLQEHHNEYISHTGVPNTKLQKIIEELEGVKG